MVIFDFVQGRVLDSEKEPEAVAEMVADVARRAAETKAFAGGVPAAKSA